jgi:4-hydroxy-3-methylbut-2-enyl diphosphate reductase
MKVIRASVLGFCMGVRRAVDIAGAALNCKRNIYSLGPLIHNSRILNELKALGLDVLNELPSDLRNTDLIIRAHGVSPLLEKAVCERGGRLIDATCLKVKASQLKARGFEESGVRLFIAGEAGHAEISGLKGYAPSSIIAGNAIEAESKVIDLFRAFPDANTAIIAQTTYDEHEYSLICECIKKYYPNLKIVMSICTASTERQNSLRCLLGTVDAIIVAGSGESANTRRLAEIARDHGTPCILAESPDDIPPDFFTCQTIGLCAGASAPDSLINEIETALHSQVKH